MALLALTLIPRTRGYAQSSEPDFTIIVLPDPQWYAANDPIMFDQQIQWIVNNISTLNIKLVFDVGDTVNGGGEASQWQSASASIARMDGKVPYFLAIGNHDYNANDPQNRTAAATNYNYYFGPSRYANSYSGWLGSYPAGSNENFYAAVTINGKRYLVLSLEFYPRSSSLQWAANIVAQNPDAEVLIVTHGYEYFDNTRVALCDNYNAEYYGLGTDNDGDEMWRKLVSQYPNVSMLFSGHIVKGAGEMAAAHQTEAGINGNIVNELLINGQAMTNGGQGYLRILTVSASRNQIMATTYSPILHSYLTDAANQYTVPWHATATSGSGTITGRVKDANCTRIAGAQVSYANGTATTDTYGNFALSNVPAKVQAVTVQAAGYTTSTQTVPVEPGLTNSALFFLSKSGACTTTTVGVKVCSPLAGSSVTSPVHFIAAAKGTNTITAMKIYIDNIVGYSTSAASLDVSLALPTGPRYVVVQAWDSAGTVYKTPLNITVAGGPPTPTPTPSPSPTPAPTPTPRGTGTISGRVTNISTGAAVSVATVGVSSHSTATDASGNYALTALTPGTYTVSVTKSGWLPQSKSGSVTSGATTTVNFALATAGKLAGTLQSSTGAAISGATVTFKGGVIANSTSVKTSSNGTYSSAWIPVGSYSVTVSMTGHTTQAKAATVSTGTTTTVNFTNF